MPGQTQYPSTTAITPSLRILAVGDIHGCLTAFTTLLEVISPAPDDLVITVGDYIDRGPDSAGVIDRLLLLQTQCHLLPIRGNHDLMMLDARGDGYNGWLSMGGDATLRSYGGGIDRVPSSHWNFLSRTSVDSVETATHLFVHGGVDPDRPVADQAPFNLQWTRFPPSGPHVSGKVVVSGHTTQANGLPRNMGYAVGIDTGVDRGGYLTALDVSTGTYWQANEAGKTRTGRLTPPEIFRAD